MKKLLLSFLLFVSFLCKAQQSIIVGPQGDCDTKGIRKNEHASSKWFDVSGVAKLKITTLQHRTFDKSRIYNESGNLIWEWGGESFNDTWYEKVHIVAIKENKIRVEFYQGYSDPFCNGSIKVEKEDREIIPQMQIVKNKGNGVYLEEKKAVVIQNSQSNNSSFKPTYKANPNSSSIIGNPIKIGNLLVAEFDFTEKMNWEDAYNSCFSLGKGWRLPTKMELNMLYNNLGKIGDVGNDGYWTSTENGSERVWTQYLFNDGYSYDVVKYGSLFVRAVGNYGVVKVTPTKARNSYNNTKCMFAENIKKPNLNFFIIDDRKLCICCNARYRRYKLNDLEDLKRSEEVNFLNARLEEHLSKTSADENHQLSDKSNLQAYLALNYGMVGYAGSLLSDALSPLMALLGGVLDLPDPLSRDRKIYRYKIVSDYCSKKCEIYCSR